MGANMARRLARGGVKVKAFDVSPVARTTLQSEAGITPMADLAAMVGALATARVVWLMLPAGNVTQTTLDSLVAPVMSPALMMRLTSQGKDDYANRLLAMMRNSFGGHLVQHEK
jgi:6-phosphogluconate dehydrogenase (decarboxylating)